MSWWTSHSTWPQFWTTAVITGVTSAGKHLFHYKLVGESREKKRYRGWYSLVGISAVNSIQCFNTIGLMTGWTIAANVKKVKFSHTRYRALGPEVIPVYRQLARRWLKAMHPAVDCHYFPPCLRLPSQPKSVTAHRPAPKYTAWWQRHMHVNSLPKAVTWKQTGRGSNRRHLESRTNALPLSHTGHYKCNNCKSAPIIPKDAGAACSLGRLSLPPSVEC